MRASDALYGNLVRPALLSLLRALPDDPGQFDAAIAPIEAGGWKIWEEFFFYATYHGVLGAIEPELTRNTRLSTQVHEAVERRRALEHLWNAHVMKGLEDAVRVLTQAGIETCALKGPVLAARLYETAAARHCIDVDLLVHRTDVDRALRALMEAGYATNPRESATYVLNYGHHFKLSRAGTAAVELHFRPYAGFGVELPANLILARATPVPLPNSGLSVLVLSPEDEFIYLAAHAAGHSFIRFVWLYDLKLFVRRFPALNWHEVAKRAEAFGLATVVAYTILLLERWLGVRVRDLPDHLTRRGLRSRIADRLLKEASTPGDKSLRDNLSGLFFTSMLCDTTRSASWLLQHHLWRATRRRLHRLAPRYLPDRWSA